MADSTQSPAVPTSTSPDIAGEVASIETKFEQLEDSLGLSSNRSKLVSMGGSSPGMSGEEVVGTAGHCVESATVKSFPDAVE